MHRNYCCNFKYNLLWSVFLLLCTSTTSICAISDNLCSQCNLVEALLAIKDSTCQPCHYS